MKKCKCGKKLSNDKSNQCRECYNNSLKGLGNPNYIDGRAINRNCIDCGILIPNKYAIRCGKCYIKFAFFGKKENHPHYIKGKSFKNECIDCGQNINRHSLRCQKCYHISRIGIKGVSHTEETKKKMSKKRIKYLLTHKGKFKDTDIEIIMEKELQKRSINYMAQYRIKNHLADFYLPDYLLIIECDGLYWHNRPEIRARDKVNNKMMRELGYNIIRLTDKVIKNSLNKILDNIL